MQTQVYAMTNLPHKQLCDLLQNRCLSLGVFVCESGQSNSALGTKAFSYLCGGFGKPARYRCG